MGRQKIKYDGNRAPRYTPAERMPISTAAIAVAGCHFDAKLLPDDVTRESLDGYVLVPKVLMNDLLKAFPAEPMHEAKNWPSRVRAGYIKKLRALGVLPPATK